MCGVEERKETAHIPILILTAKAEDKDSVEAAYLGADEYIRKPFNPEVLLAKVAQLLDMRRRLKQIYTKTMLNVTGQEKDGKNSGRVSLCKRCWSVSKEMRVIRISM